MDYVKLFDSIVKGTQDNKYLVFTLCNQTYAFPAVTIVKIIEINNLSKIPDAPAYISGITEYSGEVVPVIELKKILGYEVCNESKRKIAIVAQLKKKKCSFVVDSVNSLENVGEKDKQSTELLKDLAEKEFVNTILKIDNRLIMALNIEKLLDFDKLSLIMEVIKNNNI